MVTIKAVAAEAGLSLATVSYALRNNPKISACTRHLVQTIARDLGYRPNPRVASLMAHIRGAQSPRLGERIAFVWMHTDPALADRDPFLRHVFAGARLQAEQSGFELESFWTNSAGMTDRRLQQIILARGIVGVVLSPVVSAEASVALDWHWDLFSTAVIGNVTWNPELHHAGHHHFLGMRMALHELRQLGLHRPAVLLDEVTNERAKRAWEGAYMADGRTLLQKKDHLAIIGGRSPALPANWLKAVAADALIVSGTRGPAQPMIEEARRLALPIVTLDWNLEAPGIGGIDQCSDRIAAYAVDLVVSQLYRNETGAPDFPRMMLFPGRWVAPCLGTLITGRPRDQGGESAPTTKMALKYRPLTA